MNFIPNHSNLSFQKKFLKRCVTAGIIIELNISCSFHLFDAREGVYPDVPGHLSTYYFLLHVMYFIIASHSLFSLLLLPPFLPLTFPSPLSILHSLSSDSRENSKFKTICASYSVPPHIGVVMHFAKGPARTRTRDRCSDQYSFARTVHPSVLHAFRCTEYVTFFVQLIHFVGFL